MGSLAVLLSHYCVDESLCGFFVVSLAEAGPIPRVEDRSRGEITGFMLVFCQYVSGLTITQESLHPFGVEVNRNSLWNTRDDSPLQTTLSISREERCNNEKMFFETYWSFMKPIVNVALYARVSTRDKGQDNENQLAQLREFCRRHDWTIVQEYVDRATGKHSDRE